jgi:hypothetical protein
VVLYDDTGCPFDGLDPLRHFVNVRMVRVGQLLQRVHQTLLNEKFDPNKWEAP